MHRPITLGSLNRGKNLLASCLSVVVGIAALAAPLHAPWLHTAGLIAIALGALLGAAIVARRTGVESEREKVELDRRTRVPITSITRVNPIEIGIDPAAQSILPGERLPRYLARDIDEELRAAVRAALDGSGLWIVVAHGNSKVGKSRALFEALLYCAGYVDLELVAPVDCQALWSLITPGEMPRRVSEHSVLWLDDLEPFLNQGLTLNALREWRASAPGRIVVATYGGKGSDMVAGSASGALATIAGELLQHASQLSVQATTSRELDPLRFGLDTGVLESIEKHGLAAYLVAAPSLERKLSTRGHELGEPECPEGMALIEAAIDWARCGRTDSISGKKLRKLWQSYLPARVSATDARFNAGRSWALTPVAGTIALLEQHVGGYRAYDYIVQFMANEHLASPPRDAAWAVALSEIGDAQAVAVGMAASRHGRYEDALVAFGLARSSSSDEVAAVASFNAGVVLGLLGRHVNEIAAYDEMIARFGEAVEPTLRGMAATAMVNRAITLIELDRHERAVAGYDEVIARFGEEAEPVTREQVTVAMVNKANILGVQDRYEEAVAIYDEVVERFGEATEPGIRKQVAMSLLNKAITFDIRGDHRGIIVIYDEIIARFGDATESVIREEVVKIMVDKAVRLGSQDLHQEAVVTFDEVIARFSGAVEPVIREQVAIAMANRAIMFDMQHRYQEAVVAYEEVIACFGGALEPVIREQVAGATVNRAVTLGKQGLYENELAAYGEIVARFADAVELPIRECVAKALFNKAARLDERERSDEAIVVYTEVVTRFGDAIEPSVRNYVAMAMVNRAIMLEKQGHYREAVAVNDEIIRRFGDAVEPALCEHVAGAMIDKAIGLAMQNLDKEAVSVCEEVVARFGDANEPPIREYVAEVTRAMAKASPAVD